MAVRQAQLPAAPEMEPLCRVACSKSSSRLPSSGPRSLVGELVHQATLGAEVGGLDMWKQAWCRWPPWRRCQEVVVGRGVRRQHGLEFAACVDRLGPDVGNVLQTISYGCQPLRFNRFLPLPFSVASHGEHGGFAGCGCGFEFSFQRVFSVQAASFCCYPCRRPSLGVPRSTGPHGLIAHDQGLLKHLDCVAAGDIGRCRAVERGAPVTVRQCHGLRIGLWSGAVAGARLAVSRFKGRGLVLAGLNTLLALPSVVVGLVVACCCRAQGRWGFWAGCSVSRRWWWRRRCWVVPVVTALRAGHRRCRPCPRRAVAIAGSQPLAAGSPAAVGSGLRC